MTSTHITNFEIRRKDTWEVVGSHRQNYLCKAHWEDLLKFQPTADFEIQAWGYDEDEDFWEGEWQDLCDFLLACKVKID